MNNENKLTKNFIIGTFVTLYIMVSIISTIHVIEFFALSNPRWLAITLALAFEVGAAASLASIIALKKMNKSIVWMLFFILTAMQAMGNAYFAYVNLKDYKEWIELFGLVDYEPIFQKRILSIVSGAILPLVALGFIKSLVDYIRPEEEVITEPVNTQITDSVTVVKEPEEVASEELVVIIDEDDDIVENEKLFDNEESLINLSYREEDEPIQVDDQITEELEEPVIVEEINPEIQEEINNITEEIVVEEEKVSEDLVSQKPIEVIVDNKEIYPVYDELKKEKNPVIDNVMVFNKNGNQ